MSSNFIFAPVLDINVVITTNECPNAPPGDESVSKSNSLFVVVVTLFFPRYGRAARPAIQVYAVNLIELG